VIGLVWYESRVASALLYIDVALMASIFRGWLSGLLGISWIAVLRIGVLGGTIVVVGTGDHWVTAFHIPGEVLASFLFLAGCFTVCISSLYYVRAKIITYMSVD
jgi:hypothetical protein